MINAFIEVFNEKKLLNSMIRFYSYIHVGKPIPDQTNITLGVTDTTGIEFSTRIIAYPDPRYELIYDNGTNNNQMTNMLTRNAVNSFTIHYNQTVVDRGDYGTYRLIVSNSFGETIIYVNILPQSK